MKKVQATKAPRAQQALALWAADPEAAQAVRELRASLCGVRLAASAASPWSDAFHEVWGEAVAEHIGVLHYTLLDAGWSDEDADEVSDTAWRSVPQSAYVVLHDSSSALLGVFLSLDAAHAAAAGAGAGWRVAESVLSLAGVDQ